MAHPSPSCGRRPASPTRDVCRLGRPHWLDRATGDAGLLDQPFTDEGTAHVLRGAVHLPDAPGPAGLVLLRDSAPPRTDPP
ncbi:hypothetical protein ACFV4F_11865 [Kitasatospora sp. NPDC059722]|uniref:hypothetical protein n=1 Tax=Kitasatospora sp. NPDC059722 TaxID=3346925 RepID=UPI0036BF8C95